MDRSTNVMLVVWFIGSQIYFVFHYYLTKYGGE